MSTARSDESGIPRTWRRLSAPPGREESWLGANKAKAEKLRGRNLERRAGAYGFGLRHSEYGYALIDPTRKRIEDRSDMTLDEVESWLDRASER